MVTSLRDKNLSQMVSDWTILVKRITFSNGAVSGMAFLSAHERQVAFPAAHSAADIQHRRVLAPPEPQRVLQLWVCVQNTPVSHGFISNTPVLGVKWPSAGTRSTFVGFWWLKRQIITDLLWRSRSGSSSTWSHHTCRRRRAGTHGRTASWEFGTHLLASHRPTEPPGHRATEGPS